MKQYLAAIVVFIACNGLQTGAQPVPQPPDPAMAGKEINQGVYVRDSGGAVEKLALAQRMERLKEWDKAADVYQEVLDKFADRIVTANADGTPGSRYANVTSIVQERLANWPKQGLEAYHRRFEGAASSMLEAAGPEDAAALNLICSRYFATDAGRTAAIRLIELGIENGEFAGGAWMGERLLSYHPQLEAQRAEVLFLTGLAQHLAGDASGAAARLDELKQKHADAMGKLHGQDVVLANELAGAIATPPPVARASSADSWPIFGGDQTRARVSDATGRVGAKQRQIPLTRGMMGIMPPPVRNELQRQQRQTRDAGLTLGVIPVVDRGELFFQDNAYIYARSIESGMALPGWLATYPGDPDGRYGSPNMPPMPPNTQMTVTVTDKNVLAVQRQFEPMTTLNEAGNINNVLQASGDTKLVCLDRATGAERWAVSPAQFADPNLRELELGGSPLVVGDLVYINARGGKPMQFEDAYVLCFGAVDGKLRWASYLASGNALGNMMQGRSTLSANASHVAYAGGRIYSSTELGAVAAVDAYTGQIVWLNLYPRPVENFAAIQAGAGNLPYVGPRKPWAQNPVFVDNGKVLAMPSDARFVLVYDAGSGQEIKRIPIDGFDGASTLLAVQRERLVIGSGRSIFCINWQTFDGAKPEASLLWRAGPFMKPNFSADSTTDSIRGRAFVTADSLFVPTQWALHRVSMKNGKVEEMYPKGGVWDVDEGPGNVLVTQDHVIIAGADSVDIYTDMALARARLDRAVASNPNEAAPRLEYAEVMFASGQLDVATEKMDEAIRLLGGGGSMRSGADRDRVFSDALAFAQRLTDPRTNSPERMQMAGPMFDRAAAAAYSPQQHVAYRDARARWAHDTRDLASEVRLYQEILANPQWRKVMISREGGAAQAWNVAEKTIMDLVRSRRDLYAPYEQEAAQALAALKSAAGAGQKVEAEKFMEIAERYPVASVSPEALFDAANAYEAAGKNRQATQVLNQILRKSYPVDRARLLEAQARNYLALPNGVGSAIGRLMEAAKMGEQQLRQPLELPDGRTLQGISFKAAALTLQAYSAQVASATLPDFKLPQGGLGKPFLAEAPDTLIDVVDQLLVPPRELRAGSRHDRVVTWTVGRGISLYAVGQTKPLGANAAVNEAPRGIAWAGRDLVVWTGNKLLLLSGDDAKTKWETPLKNLPVAELISDDATADEGSQPIQRGQGRVAAGMIAARAAAAAGVEAIDRVRPLADRIIIATSTARVAALEMANGQLAWQTRVAEAPLERLAATDDFVAVQQADDLSAQLVALETLNGQVVYRKIFIPSSGEQPALNMGLAADGTLVWSLTDRVCGKDLYDPGKNLKFGKYSLADNGQMFNGAVGEEQLIVADGRILAISDAAQYLRVLSLDNGREGNSVRSPLPTQSPQNNWNVYLRVIGPRLYVVNPRNALGYNLNNADDTWVGLADTRSGVMRESFFGRDHVVIIGQVIDASAAPAVSAGRYRVTAYSRAIDQNTGKESGQLDVSEPITHPAGIDQWQGVEGGFYYRSLDRKLHFLRGAAQ